MIPDDKERQLVGKVRQALDESVQNLDARTLSRLNQARQKSLSEPGPGLFERLQFSKFSLAGGAAAAIVLIVALFHLTNPSDLQTYSELEDVEILATGDSPDFFSELDFFTWLAEEMENAG